MNIPVSRDRLSRPVDISTLLHSANRRVNLIVDEPGLRRVGLRGYAVKNTSGNGSARGGGLNESRVGGGRYQQRAVVARTPGNSTARRGGGRGRIQRPSWYQSTPLRDITSLTRAVERRREELGMNHEADAPQEARSDLSENTDLSTPIPAVAVKPHLSPAIQLLKIKAGNIDCAFNTTDFLTPQKKLLNSIDKVREVWLENQRKLEQTPAAKRLEREKKVRVLLSMR